MEERRRKEQTEKTLLGPAKNNEGILPIGVVCTGPTWFGPMLDLGVTILTKKRGRSQPNRKMSNPNSRTENTEKIRAERTAHKPTGLDCMKKTFGEENV